MDYANLIIIAYEFTHAWLNCVNLCAEIDSCSVVCKVSDLAHHSALIYTLPQPCRRYSCGGVTHNRRVSDALHHHCISDTMSMSPD